MKRLSWILVALLVAASAVGVAQPKLKMRIAVAPLDWSEKNSIDNWTIPVEFRNAIYEKLVKRLLDSGRFIVLEREAMEALLNEKAIKEETSGQNQARKITPAQALVKGKVTDFELHARGAGGGGGVLGSVGGIGIGARTNDSKVGINVRIFDVDSSELIASEDATGVAKSVGFSISGGLNQVFGTFSAYEKSPLGEATTKAINTCVDKIIQKLDKRPWQAFVADWDGDAKEVTINAGSDAGVSEGDVFEVHRVTKEIRDPDTGELLGKKTVKAGMIKVTSVEKKFAVCMVIEGSEFAPGDVVRSIK